MNMKVKEYYHASGSDKRAIARVFMSPGTGIFNINGGRDLENYFPRETNRMIIKQPLNIVNMENNFDFKVSVNGGGSSGQADAIRLAIARALVKYYIAYYVANEQEILEVKRKLRSIGALTRDKRKVERKKCGLRKARKKEQYSKR